jgi:hypothetical protein
MKFGCKNNYLESNEGTLAKGKISPGQQTMHTQTFKCKMRAQIEAPRAKKAYHTCFLASTKEKMASMEEIINQKCQQLSKD